MTGEGHRLIGRDISRFWLRRLCEAVLFVGVSVIILYTWARFIPTGYSLPIGEAVSDLAAGVFAAISLIALICCFWLPNSYSWLVGLVMYGLLIGGIGTLILTSGQLSSPFLTAWIPVTVFAGFFGLIVAGIAALGVIGLVLFAYISAGAALPAVFGALFFGIMPIILSLILWRQKPVARHSNEPDLAAQLSTIAGKSDIVINTIDDGVLAISRDGNIELINPSAQQLIGWQQGDALGLKWQSVIKLATVDGQDVSEADNPIARALTTNRPTHTDKLMMRTNSDKRFLVSIVSSPVGPNNEGIIVVFRDITKEKAEEREQAEFISTASHEMRTPVASIEGYLGLALNPATAQIDDKARDFITKAHESAQHLGRLFQDLLDISKAEDGRLKNEPRVINVNEFIGTIFDSLTPQATAKGLSYHYAPQAADGEGERTLRPVYYSFVDADHLREVTSNLIENAIKYTPAGSVTVDITGGDRMVTISVADSGIGIPPEDIPHLFQKFYRVDNSDTREIGGTGLGLYLSRRLAESMGGHLRVESQYQKGSTFFIDIPRLDHAEAMQKIAAEQQAAAQAAQQASFTPMTPVATPAKQVTEPPQQLAPTVVAPVMQPEQQYTTPEQQMTAPQQPQPYTPTLAQVSSQPIPTPAVPQPTPVPTPQAAARPDVAALSPQPPAQPLPPAPAQPQQPTLADLDQHYRTPQA